MKEEEIKAAKKAIGEYETENLLRDLVWGEPIIRAGVNCANKDELFTLCVDFEDFEEVGPVIQDLLARAAESGVFDLAIIEASTGLLFHLIHWYMPPANPDRDHDPKYRGEVITVEISPEITFLDPTIDPDEIGKVPELMAKFANLVNCMPREADLLETLVDKEEKSPTIKVFLWHRQ